jgi:penicillin-binding protein 1A
MLRFLGLLFAAGFVVFCAVAAGAGYIIWQTSQTLPDYQQLATYEPPVMTRVHAGDGSLIGEYARERRLFVPVSAMPERLIHAFLSAEDKAFYDHPGVDAQSLLRAVVVNVQNKIQGSNRLIGASTITQQVAKNFLLTSDRTIERKLKEALLAFRIEEALSKDQILELYLNEIFLGLNSYGIAAAALNYFGKPLNDLTLPEMAYLAALPKAPNNYHPHRHTERAVERRNWVLDRMRENGFIEPEEHAAAAAAPLEVTRDQGGAGVFSAESFTEEVRREVLEIYGEDKLYTGGLSVRTTLDPKHQMLARQALASGLIGFDRKKGWRGAVARLDMSGDWVAGLKKQTIASDLAPWRLAVVTGLSDAQARIALQPKPAPGGAAEPETGTIPLSLMQWARAARDGGGLGPEVEAPADVVSVGDVVHVAPGTEEGDWHLVQIPEVNGGLVAMDPHTGRVLALVGGFSYGHSQFNRAVQALRQPGSAIKPFVYAAALDSGYTPASVVLDAPIEFALPTGETWSPQNYSREFYGPSTLRRGIELSRNAMTVRLADDMGIGKLAEFTQRLGVYDKMPRMLAMALGAGETTLLKMTTAYSVIANGGKRIEPTLIDRIQDRYGRTVYRHDQRDCPACKAERWDNQPEPEIFDDRDEVINPYTAYQITSMLEGVVERGTGKVLLEVGKPVAGKTGTTNEVRDSWFIGFTPDLTVGVYVGYDTPEPMGRAATGGQLAAPIVADFMKKALQDVSATPFRVPAGIQLIPIDPNTGERAAYGDADVILEAFKPGESPSTTPLVIGGTVMPVSTGDLGGGLGGTGVGDGGLTTGTGGLY